MCACINIYKHAPVNIHMCMYCVHVHMCTHTCAHACVCTCMKVYAYTHGCIHVGVWICTHMCVLVLPLPIEPSGLTVELTL